MQKALGISLTILASMLGTTASVHAQPLEKVNVAVSWVGLWDTSQPTFCKDRGEFQKAGLDVQIMPTRGGSETVQAVIAGGMDIGYSPGTSAVIAAFVKGAPIKIVSSEFVGQNDTYFYVPAKSPIKTVEDIAGKKVAYPRPGGATEAVLIGLKAERKLDFTAVSTGGMDATYTMTMTGQVDVGYSVPPSGLDAVAKGDIRVLFAGDIVASQRDISARVNVAHANFVKNRRDVAKKFFKVLDECIDWAYKNKDQSAKMYADINKIDIGMASEALKFYDRDKLRFSPIKGFEESVKGAIEGKFIDKDLTPKQREELIDLML
jgi:NitT/TauT family transport system substrate-binding protein